MRPVHHLVDAPPGKISQGPCERPFSRYGTVPTYTATVVLLKALTEHGGRIPEVSVAHAVPQTERTVFHDGPYESLPRKALPGNETPPTPSHGLACRGVLKKEGAAHHPKHRDVVIVFPPPEHAAFARFRACECTGRDAHPLLWARYSHDSRMGKGMGHACHRGIRPAAGASQLYRVLYLTVQNVTVRTEFAAIRVFLFVVGMDTNT